MAMKNIVKFLLLWICIVHSVSSFRLLRDQERRKKTCEKIQKSSMCTNKVHEGYNSTQFPNFLNHKDQNEATLDLRNWEPLVNIGCSKHLPTFLCAIYIPVCIEEISSSLIPPCRSLCELSKTACEPVMKKFGFQWTFDCNNYPKVQEKMCVKAVEDEKKNKGQQTKGNADKGKQSKKGWMTGTDGNTIHLNCDSNKVMFIRKIRHSMNSKCCPQATKAVLSAMCNGQNSCNVNVSKETLGAHCPGEVGVLRIKHKCTEKLKNIVQPCDKKTA